MKELKIGETMKLENGVTIKCVDVECATCTDCYFNTSDSCGDKYCSIHDRKDGKSVVFKKVEEIATKI